MKAGAFAIGSGPRRVICLHGWFGHAHAWGPMTNNLDQQGFSCLFMDYRGYGSRKGSGGPYTIAQIARDAISLADQSGWSEFALIGHSMGGLAIQHILADHPKRVQALVAIAPVPASGVPFDKDQWKFFSAAAEDPASRRAIIDLTTGNRLPAKWLNDMVDASIANSDAEAVSAYLTAWSRTNIAERIQGNPIHALVLAGEHDPALGPETCKATWLKNYPNARLEIVRNAGHYPPEETPLALVGSIEKFLHEAVPV